MSYPESRGMVQRLSARSHRYSVNGERREFRMEEWVDADGVIHLFAWTETDFEAESKPSQGTSRALDWLEQIVRGKQP